jgi:hypothetical protein
MYFKNVSLFFTRKSGIEFLVQLGADLIGNLKLKLLKSCLELTFPNEVVAGDSR